MLSDNNSNERAAAAAGVTARACASARPPPVRKVYARTIQNRYEIDYLCINIILYQRYTGTSGVVENGSKGGETH